MSNINMDGDMARRCYKIIEDNKDDLMTMSPGQFAKKYNINYRVVCHYIKVHKVPCLRYGRLTNAQSESTTIEVIKLLKQGDLSYRQIGEKVGLSKQRVGIIAKDYNLNNSRSKYDRNVQQIKELPNLKYMNARQISETLHISYAIVLKILKEENIEHAHWQQKVLSDEKFEEMLQDLRDGNISRNQIAKKYGVSINWVRKMYRTLIEPEMD